MCAVEICSSSESALWLYMKLFFSCSNWQISSWRSWKERNYHFFLVCALAGSCILNQNRPCHLRTGYPACSQMFPLGWRFILHVTWRDWRICILVLPLNALQWSLHYLVFFFKIVLQLLYSHLIRQWAVPDKHRPYHSSVKRREKCWLLKWISVFRLPKVIINNADNTVKFHKYLILVLCIIALFEWWLDVLAKC